MSTSRPGSTKGKVAGAETGFHFCLEEFAPKFVHRGKEVGKGNVFIDVEAFDLMEENVGSGADGLIAVDGAGGDDADRGFVGFHHAELGIGGMGAEEHVFGDVKGVLHVPCRMVWRKV